MKDGEKQDNKTAFVGTVCGSAYSCVGVIGAYERLYRLAVRKRAAYGQRPEQQRRGNAAGKRRGNDIKRNARAGTYS